jgi:hypothetical protein
MKKLLCILLLLGSFGWAQQAVRALGSGAVGAADAAWTSATGGNTAVTLISNSSAFNTIMVTLVQGTTITGGVVTFEQSIDNSTWTPVQGVTIGTTTLMGPTYTLVASTNVSFLLPVNAPYFRIRLSTVITGSGTVTVQHASQSLPAVGLLAGTEILAAGANDVGSIHVTDGTNVATVKAASTAPAATDKALVVAVSPNGSNPCNGPNAALQMVAGQTSGTAAVQLVALSAGLKIYVCNVTIQGISGTATPTFSLKYGTGTACATGGVTIIGAFTTVASTTYNWPGPAFITPISQALCYNQTATSPVSNYAITYVQQ